MENFNKIEDAQKLPHRAFTYQQLSKISDANYGVLNRSIDMSYFNEDDMFVLQPVMIHEHALGEPVTPHLRTYVLLNGQQGIAFQDITFQQWDMGVEIELSQPNTREEEGEDFPLAA